MKKHEKEAKESFSRLVRLKGCLKTTGNPHYGICFTCGTVMPLESIQCGHFISGRSNALFFEETNSHIQCNVCNTFKGGNLEVYREKMIDKYGLQEIERLESLRHTVQRISSSEYEEMRAKFKQEFKTKFNN